VRVPSPEPLLASLPNLRDLGGHPTADGGRVRRGLIYRSEAPCLATPADQAALSQRLRIAEVVDLRRDEEHRASPLPPAVAARARWHRVPLQVDVPPHVAEQLAPAEHTDGDMGRFYAWVARANTDRLAQVLEVLADAEAPVLVHCAVGKDRTGVVAGVLLLALGVAPDDVVADYARSDAAMRAVLPRHDDRLTPDRIDGDVRLRAPAAAMAALLDHLAEARGSPSGWLDELDPGGALRGRLRRRLVTAGRGAAAR
jgi:protein-tyrosine phosphatase